MTPEIYLGYSFARAPIGNPQGFQSDQTISYSIPPGTNFNPNIVYLDGQWKNNPDNCIVLELLLMQLMIPSSPAILKKYLFLSN